MKYIAKIGTTFSITGLIIFALGFKVAHYHLLFFSTGVLLFLTGLAVLFLLDKKDTDNYVRWRNNLRTNGYKLDVALQDCSIKSNSYVEEIIRNNTYSTEEFMLTLPFRDNEKVEYQHIDKSMLIYEAILSGKRKIFYSPIIPMSETSLIFIISTKSTSIYIDKTNEEDYFFDLDFLKN